MFIQVIRGLATDRKRLRRLFERRKDELRPGAAGFTGSTAGITDDGRPVAAARFETHAAARANRQGDVITVDTDSYADVVDFEAEAEARRGEANEIPAHVAALFRELMSAIAVDADLDLKDPWIV